MCSLYFKIAEQLLAINWNEFQSVKEVNNEKKNQLSNSINAFTWNLKNDNDEHL
jgi:hypothetical protein